MIMQAKWNGTKYTIPDEYGDIYICASLATQTPEILTNSSTATNLFLSCAKSFYTKNGANRIVSVTHRASEHNDNTRNKQLHYVQVTIPTGNQQSRKKDVVVAVIDFINKIKRLEGANDNAS